nr:DUF6801 domain-containing protein [Kibdelosporangium sp. MJ126-NF4]CEL16651.1 hypothetical protein [Kibdelosporangium sp. MJ126-NF4]CTQ88997.1 hypothetical protein [Kibdelosporangium sp. MJ126-NF4]
MSHRKRAGLAVMLAAVTIAAPPTLVTAAGGDPAATETQVVKAIRATCDFELVGRQAIAAELSLKLPVSVQTGTPVRPSDVKLKVTFSAETIKALREKQVISLAGLLGVQLKSGDRTLATRGPLPQTALPEQDSDLSVEQSLKSIVEVKTDKPGKVVLTLGALEMLLAQATTREEPTKEILPAPCELAPGQDTALGSVAVLNPLPTTVSAPKPTAPTSGQTSSAPGVPSQRPQGTQPPTAGRDKTSRRQRQLAEDPQYCKEIPPEAYAFYAYYDLTGRADVRKLKSYIDFGPGYLASKVFFWWEVDPNGEQIDCGAIKGDLLWPPATGSFVTFGFVPTTAKVTVIPDGPAEGRLRFNIFKGTAKAFLALSDAKVNGTPLDVGPNCRTAEPVVIDLKSDLEHWDTFMGGTMEADVTIPPYKGCGAKENLDPLLTGLISGPGNHLKLTFSELHTCDPPDQPCVPALPRRR